MRNCIDQNITDGVAATEQPEGNLGLTNIEEIGDL